MARDWSNDRYVRLFKPSVDHRTLCWQARVIWPLLMQEANGAGVLRARKGLAAIANAIDVPLEVVEPGVADLLADGCLEVMPDGYIIRNYVAAQTAIMSSNSRKARQREVDEAVAALAAAAEMTKQSGSQIGHATSHEVTEGHGASRDVTPSRAEPIRGEDLSHPAREGQPVATSDGWEADVPGKPDAPPPARGADSIVALLAEAAAALNAERVRWSPGAPAIDDSPAGAVTARLMATPAADRRRKLMHAVACVIAKARRTKSIDGLRWSTFGSEQAWAYVVDADVNDYARGDGMVPRDGPRRPSHQPAPPSRTRPLRDL